MVGDESSGPDSWRQGLVGAAKGVGGCTSEWVWNCGCGNANTLEEVDEHWRMDRTSNQAKVEAVVYIAVLVCGYGCGCVG